MVRFTISQRECPLPLGVRVCQTHVLFINGYGDERPRIEKKITSIGIGKPKKGLCPGKWLDKEFFIIKFK